MIIFSERINGMYRDVRGGDRRNGISKSFKTCFAKQLAGGAEYHRHQHRTREGRSRRELRLAGPDRTRSHRQTAFARQRQSRPAGAGHPAGKGGFCRTPARDQFLYGGTAYMDKLIPSPGIRDGIIGLTMDQDGVPGQRRKAGRMRGHVPDDGLGSGDPARGHFP